MVEKFSMKKWTLVNVKGKKIIVNLHNKVKYLLHIRNLMRALNHGLVLKKMQRVIQKLLKM